MKNVYLVLPAGLLFAASVSAGNTAAAHPSSAAVPAPRSLEGTTVYLRSMHHGDYLTGAGLRDLQAMLDETGFGFTLESTGSAGYRLRAVANNRCLADNLTFTSDGDAAWTLISANDSENIFAIAPTSGEATKVLTAVANPSTDAYTNPANTVALQEYRPGDHSQQWEILTEADRTARAAAEGHKGRWIDMTYRIPAFNFPEGSTQTDKWQQIVTRLENHAQVDYVADEKGGMFRYHNEEFNSLPWRSSEFTLQTELSGLPDGLYRFRCQVYNNNLNTNETNLRVWAGSENVIPPSVANDVHTAAMAGEAFRRGEGWIEVGPVEVSGGNLTIKFEKRHTTSATAFCIDNLRLLYQPAVDPADMTVTLSFPMHYNTLILPFAVSEEEVAGLNADGLHFFRTEGYEERTQNSEVEGSVTYHLITLNPEDSHSLLPNVPYVVVNTNVEELKGRPLQGPGMQPAPFLSAPAPAATAGQTFEYTFSGQPVNANYYYTDQTDGMQTLTGAFVATNIFPGHYNLAASQYLQGFMQNASDAPRHIEPYRAYVNSISSSAARYPLFLFNDDFNILTGIEDVTDDPDSAITDTTPVDVYSAGGVLLRRGVLKAEALNDLPRGIYILSNGPTTLKLAK